jgi:hypothetical protein
MSRNWYIAIIGAPIVGLALRLFVILLPALHDCDRRHGVLVRGFSLTGYVCVDQRRPAL